MREKVDSENLDRILLRSLSKTDMLLVDMYSKYASISEQLQGQKYWNNNIKIAGEMHDSLYNMSMSIARDTLLLVELEGICDEIRGSREGSRGRRR